MPTPAPIDNVSNVATLKGLEGLFQNVISSFLGIAGIVLFIVLLTAGVKFITSGGDPKGLESAKKTLTFAIIGIVFVAAGYLILVLVSDFTGNTGILDFKITL